MRHNDASADPADGVRREQAPTWNATSPTRPWPLTQIDLPLPWPRPHARVRGRDELATLVGDPNDPR